MRLAWHIVRKDVIRLRWILVLWAVVLCGGLGMIAIQSGLDAETYFPFYIAAKVTMQGLVPLIAFGLVMGLLHDDSVAEVDAFWITRPISGGDLLRAKALALLIFGLIPITVTLPFWLSHDYGWNQILWASRQTLQFHFLIVAVALPFAVMSANGSKFVMNVLLGAGGFLLLALLQGLGGAVVTHSLAPEVIQSRTWLIAVLWVATALVVTLNQFLRRDTSRSRWVLAVAVTAGFVVAKWWPWRVGVALNPPTAAPAMADARLRQGLPVFPIKINGEVKRVVIAAEVPLREGASASHEGETLAVQTVLLDYTGQLLIAFSEATPNLSAGFRDLFPVAEVQTGPAEYYLITNHGDERTFVIKPGRLPNELEAATLRFSHSNAAVRPASAWQPSAPPDVAAWLKGAVLIKAIVDDFGSAQPRDAAQLSP